MKTNTMKMSLILGSALLATVCLTGCSSTPKVNLNDYVEVTFSGYDGYGTAQLTVDTAAIASDYDGKFELDEDLAAEGFTAEDVLDFYIGAYLDTSSGLSNGDTVTLNWDVYASSIESDLNAEISYEEMEIKVTGLDEIESFDAFENVSVEFSGTSPDATASLVISDPELSSSYFTLSQTSDLSVGDTVTVTISESAQESMIQNMGKVPEETSREYTVEGVAYYVTSLDDIPQDALEKMQSQAEDVFSSYMASIWDYEERTLESLSLSGYYFLSAKTYRSGLDTNVIYLVYKVQVNQMGYDLSYYWYIGFNDGIILEDGTYSMDYSDYDAPSGGWFSGTTVDLTSADGTTLTYRGYQDLDSMFNNLVTKNVEYYTYESTVEE